MIDRDVFLARVRANPFGGAMTQGRVDGTNAILDQWERRHGDGGDLRWLAYMLATTKWETGHMMKPVEEWGHGAGQPYGVADPRTGQIYDGRGDVQLTWEANYQKMGDALGLDPEFALQPDIAADILFMGMEHGMFTGVGLPRYFNDTVDDPMNARRIINGTDHAADVAPPRIAG